LLIINVPTGMLPAAAAYQLYRLWWQIELIFKQPKSVMGIHKSYTGIENHLRCEFFGRLIMTDTPGPPFFFFKSC
jgi:hypothetical protein